MRTFFSRFLLATILLASSSLISEAQLDDEDVSYVLTRYVQAMGGRAALERIISVRLNGDIHYPDGSSHSITVLKKKPAKVRVILDTGQIRFIQAYDGTTPWFARESGKHTFHDRLRGDFATSFIREAPLENVLINPGSTMVRITLGPEITLAQALCYQVIASFPDKSKIIYYIEKESFLERRILEYGKEGNLIAEMVPGKFEMIDGVSFAMQLVRLKEGKVVSTLNIKDVQTNIGILDTAFISPVDLPSQ